MHICWPFSNHAKNCQTALQFPSFILLPLHNALQNLRFVLKKITYSQFFSSFDNYHVGIKFQGIIMFSTHGFIGVSVCAYCLFDI